MKKCFLFLKSFFAIGLCVTFMAGSFAACKEKKYMDIYLIGGQSNAAGYTQFFNTTEEETYTNVWYAGQTDRKSVAPNNALDEITTNSDFLQNYQAYKREISYGLGTAYNRIGLEYGMASVFTQTATKARPTLLFKTAAGGSSLVDEDSVHGFGNWYPRSCWEEWFAPVLDVPTADSTGVLYQLFVDNFRKVYEELKKNGWTPVVKGMAWMQGENDIGHVAEYEPVLKAFIRDLRADLVQITGDKSLEQMPFVIGEVCSSYEEYNNEKAMEMSAMQRKIAAELAGSRVASINTDDLAIHAADGSVLGFDKYHYNLKDEKTLGKRFAEKLLQLQA